MQPFANGLFCADFPALRAVYPQTTKEQHPMIEKQFGTEYGPALNPATRPHVSVNLQAEIDRARRLSPTDGCEIYETLLFGFYNPRTGQCFPSHQAIATKARCSVSTVQRALKWARDNSLIQWAHGLVRDGWRVLRTSNRYAFAAFLSIRRTVSLQSPPLTVKDAEEYPPHINPLPRSTPKPVHFLFLPPLAFRPSGGRKEILPKGKS